MFCQKCGNQLPDSSKFCINCGAPVEVPPVAQPVAEPVAAPVAEPVAAPVAEPVAEPVATPVADPIAPPVSPDYAPVPEMPSYVPYNEPAPQGYAPAPNQFTYAPPADVAPTPAPKKKSAKKVIIPIVAIIVAAAIAVGVYFAFFANKKYYMSKVTTYYYDEDGEKTSTYTRSTYGKSMFPLEYTYESEDYSASVKFELDDNNKKIVGYTCDIDGDDESENYTIDIEYEKEDGKQVGTGSHKNEDGVKEEIEIVYESDDEFTITMKTDGELSSKYICYIDDDGYTVTEIEKTIYVYDGVNPISYKSYEREDEDDDFELMYSTEYTYNKDGFLIETYSKSNYSDEETTYKTVYERDKNNVPTSITKYVDGEKSVYTEIDKEDDDKIILEVIDNDDDETLRYEEYGFEGKKITYVKTYDEDMNLTNKTTYNKDGLPEEEIEYYESGEIYCKTVYEYEKR